MEISSENKNNQKPTFAKIILNDDVGVFVDISNRTVNGSVISLNDSNSSINQAVYESVIELLCEKLSLIRKKPERNLGSYKKIKPKDSGYKCPICLDVFQEGLYKRTLSCQHTFHKKCVDKWLKDEESCPICRKKL